MVALVLGALLGLLALAVLAGGGAALWADRTQRDHDGYFMTGRHAYVSTGYAIDRTGADVTGVPGWVDLGKLLRIRIDAAAGGTAGKPLFVGIAPTSAVDAYLARVPHGELKDMGVSSVNPTIGEVGGTTAPAAPATKGFWVASATGTHPVLSWSVEKGDWSVVVMNADGSQGVSSGLRLGADVGYMGWIWGGLLAAGGVLLLLALGLIWAGGRRGTGGGDDGGHPSAVTRDDVPAGLAAPGGAREQAPLPALTGPYPAALSARLDEPLSRGLWLVKWLLLVPHLIVLAVLWPVFCLLTLLAALAILFTGRYPRGIFDLNVGVLRWTWRVHYYGYGALGTDRYPPFSLADDPDYPARLDVAYPEHLSHGLVLVKWLLAVPHLLVICIVAGGGAWFGHDSWPGLVGVLTLIAAVMLLFGRRYPRGLFDLLLGIHRWTLRTVAYVALMTDEYPPFRLDTGGDEPHGVPPGAVATA